MVKKILNKLKSKEIIILIFILLIGLLFRTYKLEELYIFEHDQDLFSWIVKDILVDKHLRLIGQLTSIDGLFIGPFFYYLLVPFFALTNLNPVGALIPAILLGLITVWSFYFVFVKLFNVKIGIIAAFLYSVSLGSVFYDRWVVPTQPVVLWSVWYLYILFNLLKGNLKVLWILAILAGLTLSIHIALAPLFLMIPIALFLAKRDKKLNFKKVSKKNIFISLLLLLILVSPYFIFEIRHNFSQSQSLLISLTDKKTELTGVYRFMVIFESFVRLVRGMFIQSGFSIPFAVTSAVWLIFLLAPFYFLRKKIFSKNQLILIYLWIAILILSLQFSKRPVSEYYLLSLFIPFLLVFSILLSFLKKWLLVMLALIYLIFNVFSLLNLPNSQTSYYYKKQVTEYIKEDAKQKGYPCVAINYIAKFGTAVGFRYLLWWKGVEVINPNEKVPVYSIVIPYSTSENEINIRLGHYGVIVPKDKQFNDKTVCNDPKYQLIDLLGFTN